MAKPSPENEALVKLERDFLEKYSKALGGVKGHGRFFGQALAGTRASIPELGQLVKYPNSTFEPIIGRLKEWLERKLPADTYPDAQEDIDNFIRGLRGRHAVYTPPSASAKPAVGSHSHHNSIRFMDAFLEGAPLTPESRNSHGRISTLVLLQNVNHYTAGSRPRIIHVIHDSTFYLFNSSPQTFAFYTEAARKLFLDQLTAEGEERTHLINRFDALWSDIATERDAVKLGRAKRARG